MKMSVERWWVGTDRGKQEFRGGENCPSAYVEIKCQLDATEVFIADLIACSTCFGHHYAHHPDA